MNEKILKDIITLSSNTLAGLFNTHEYNKINEICIEWFDYCKNSKKKYKNWMDCLNDFIKFKEKKNENI